MSDSARKAAEEIAAAFDPIHPTTKAAFVDRMSAIIAKHFPPAPIPAMGERGWTLADLRSANMKRQAEWCPDPSQQPDLSFRAMELAGETGEACNVAKKLVRERMGWRGSRATPDDLGSELADIVICADLTALAESIDLMAAVRDKFNETTAKVGLTTLLTPSPSPLTEEPITTAENTPRCVCGLVLGHEGNCSGAGPVIGTFQHLMFLLCDIAHEAFHILDDADGDALRAVTMPMRVDKLDAAFTALTGSEDGDPHEIIRVIRDRLVKEGK